MPKVDIPSLVKKLPENVRDQLFSEELTDKRSEIFKQFNIFEKQAEKVNELIWQVYAREFSLPEFLRALEKEAELTKEVVRKIGAQIIGWHFLPVADFLGVDVAGYLKEIGADPQIFMQYANPVEVARDLAEHAGLNFTEERLAKRLEDIILNRLNNVRDDLETKNVLMRGVKLGGLELDEAKAVAILELIKVELESLVSKRIILKEEKQAIIEAKPPMEVSPPLIEAKHRTENKADFLVEAKLRPKMAEVSLPKPTLPLPRPTPPPPRPALPRPNFATPNLSGQAPPSAIPSNLPLVEEEEKQAEIKPKILVEAKPKFTEAKLPPQAQPEVSLRNVSFPRTRPGDILAPDEAGEVKAFASKTPKSQFNVDDIIKNSLTRIQEEAAIKLDDPLIVSRFAAAVSNRLKDIRDSVETKDLLTRVVNLGGVGLAQEAADKVIKILDNEFSRVHEDLRAAKETEIRAVTQKRQEASETKKNEAEKNKEDELEGRWQKLVKRQGTRDKSRHKVGIPTEASGKQEAPLIQAKPSVASPSTLPAQAGFTQEVKEQAPKPTPSLEDVKYTPRLVGPLEELKNFTLDDLRKLSARPADASRRLLDKLEVLRGEAMEKKIVGIGAFKASPLWQSYVEVINKALQVGQSPKDIIAARLAADKGAINQDEFDAIIGLSANLRY